MSFRSKWIDFSPETPKKRTDKSDKRAFVSFVTSIPEGFSDKTAVGLWTHYPDLDPEEWQVEETADCFYGRKRSGKQLGVIAFLLPKDRLPEAQPAQVPEQP